MSNSDFNKDCAARLKQLRFQDYVAVVGAGLSHDIAVGIKDLIAKMERVSGIPRGKDENGAHEPQWRFYDKIYNSGSKAYFEILKESFDTTRPLEGLAYKQLVKFPFKGFVTLNFDDLLPRAYKDRMQLSKIPPRFSVYTRNKSIILPSEFTPDKQCLVAVHGCKNQDDPNWHENLILRFGDYEDAYEWKSGKHPPFLYLWWYWLLTTSSCIFIGTSLEEPGLDAIIRDISDNGRESVRKQKHIHLTDEKTGNSYEIIERIIYDKLDDDHIGLVNILTEALGENVVGPPVLNLRRSPLRTDFKIR